ncbi:hypothetical protein [Lederbergia galactosidilytica]|uniref:Uncharacterized protein n=1 Tax=Lederbergia galactosidilytica TaxID=217031 RepID=A0A0Q9XKL5_9BACI|nr:hypothetical protein [Lederbergia galactosidilytica]KRG08749.1 hypothetical protein ACA29_24650 [Lederbergia galactosidilytica]KRG15819.1 hypothetical protein ACA30_04400 [Virgibacillus soli]MBP1915510.1 ABC-type polysaccharide transport system permease subunit [Lederbergia galactosidilytica]OAK67573.1 hypothetical protein ABB05_20850 [Lederbergia galactosidilytica]
MKMNPEQTKKANSYVLNPNKRYKIAKLGKDLISQRQLQVMAILGVIWMIIFNYVPIWFNQKVATPG